MRANTLAFSDTFVPSDAALTFLLNAKKPIPPKLRPLNAAHTHFFYTKMHFFLKKFAYVHFL